MGTISFYISTADHDWFVGKQTYVIVDTATSVCIILAPVNAICCVHLHTLSPIFPGCKSLDFPVINPLTPLLRKFHWFLNIISSSGALGDTRRYWDCRRKEQALKQENSGNQWILNERNAGVYACLNGPKGVNLTPEKLWIVMAHFTVAMWHAILMG